MMTPLIYPLENAMAYNYIEACRLSLIPFREALELGERWSQNPFIYDNKIGRFYAASYELADRLTMLYPKPEFGINLTTIDGRDVAVKQSVVFKKKFCNLLHFTKNTNIKQPKLLIVAPMSGHHATLLRGTVEGLLPFFDIYITDWVDAKNIPLWEGTFDLDDYIDYLIEFFEFLSPSIHVLGVCQPAVPVLAATSIMSELNSPFVPASMILMGGPIDTRRNPTQVNDIAVYKNIDWFESRLVTRVPINYPGYMRPVYPGFFQLLSFLSMNVKRHMTAHSEFFESIVNGDEVAAEAHRKFYNEYFAVMDMTAEFYLQTIQVVFQDKDLALGKMMSRERKVEPAAITKTALLGIEGELDDIAGIGQTQAALELCKNLPDNMKYYYLQKDVGHYGVFSGRRFRKYIVPIITEFAYKHNKS
ncbi:Poly-beta-hydroxyalkanoate depolymerase [Rickettsiales bacterium Ac37b]|nr:Poly-beta-hydroxyalkanoate depolymerase [Rickettsiales bacterium Ac37b]